MGNLSFFMAHLADTANGVSAEPGVRARVATVGCRDSGGPASQPGVDKSLRGLLGAWETVPAWPHTESGGD